MNALTTDPLPQSTYALFQHAARQYGDAPALVYIADAAEPARAETTGYRELLTRITQAANLFHRLGARPDTVIAYALPNLPQTHAVLWGAEAAGIAFAVNPALGAEAIAQLLAAAGASILVLPAPDAGDDLLDRLAPQFAACPRLKTVLTIGAARRAVALPGGIGCFDFDAEAAREPADDLASGRVIGAQESSSWFGTGGTTGLPKIARRTHGNEVANAAMFAAALGGHVGPGRRFFCGLPLFHVNAILVTGLVPWLTGGCVVLGPAQGYRDKAVIAHFWRLVEAQRINIFSGVPTIFSALLQRPVEGHDLGSLDFAVCGAAPMPVELFRDFERSTGLRIVEAYGLTESTCAASCNPVDGERRIGSIGQCLPGGAMCTVILDDDGRYLRDAATDEIGVVAIAGPNVFDGYLSEAHNRGLWIARGDGRRWLNSGDLGRRDAEGYYWLAGRKKQLIIRGGHNIDPASIEEPLHAHPAVALAAAVGRPDAYAGELPVAYVQLKAGATASEDELLAFARAQIGEPAARPKAVRVIEQIPVTAVGKIFKPELVRREIADVVRAEAANAGTPVAHLEVRSDERRGLVAEVRTAAAPEKLRQALARYAFAAEVEGEGA